MRRSAEIRRYGLEPSWHRRAHRHGHEDGVVVVVVVVAVEVVVVVVAATAAGAAAGAGAGAAAAAALVVTVAVIMTWGVHTQIVTAWRIAAVKVAAVVALTRAETMEVPPTRKQRLP